MLIADGERGLQRLLDIVGYGAKKLGMTRSPGKSKILVSWRKPIKGRVWKCGSVRVGEGKRARVSVELEEEGEYLYLGVWVQLYGDMYEKQAEAMITKGKRHRSMNTLIWLKSSKLIWVAEKIWKAVAVPAILYGSEVIPLKDKQIEKIETIQRDVIRGF